MCHKFPAKCLLWLLVFVACGEVTPARDELDAAPSCAAPQHVCDGTCITTESVDHCGGCDPCSLANATSACVASACVVQACDPGFCDLDDAVPGCETRVDTQTDPSNCGACGTTCESGTCIAGTCALRAFLTVNRYAPNFGGLAGADAVCLAEATAQTLGGSWKAWLGDATGSPSTRFSKTAHAYIRLDGQKIANNFSDLGDGVIAVPVNVMANGVVDTSASDETWSNVRADGTPVNLATSCANWTSLSSTQSGDSGLASAVDSSWTFAGGVACSAPGNDLHLYCFEQAVH
jgi:hypothetical protein